MTLRGLDELRAAIQDELRGSLVHRNAALRLIDEFAANQRSHLRMGKVKIGDFLQRNGGAVVPIALNGVLILEIDDEDPENLQDRQESTQKP